MSPVATNTDVIAEAVRIVSVPKAAEADSFVLHAPLELMARVQLLQWLPHDRQRPALAMIERLADQYAACSPDVQTPLLVSRPPDAASLLAAVAAGQIDLVDSLATAWLPQWSAAEVVATMGEALAPSLGAAGHAPIGLAMLLRDARMPATLLRGPLRALATRPSWRISWHERVSGDGDPDGLYNALRAAPQLGRPGSDFIYPLMTQAVESGQAERLLGPLLADRYDVAQALRTVTRVAAWSMLYDDQSQAPYGWTHALTMPQAVLSLAGVGVLPRTALAVAATFSLGFRLAHGTVELPPQIEPAVSELTCGDIAAAASVHDDAHLVKYTLACFHAAAHDSEFAGLYLAAAAHLVGWWNHRAEDL